METILLVFLVLHAFVVSFLTGANLIYHYCSKEKKKMEKEIRFLENEVDELNRTVIDYEVRGHETVREPLEKEQKNMRNSEMINDYFETVLNYGGEIK